MKQSYTEMLRQVRGFNLKDGKKNMEVRKLLGLEPVSLLITWSRLWWFEQAKHKDDADWVK